MKKFFVSQMLIMMVASANFEVQTIAVPEVEYDQLLGEIASYGNDPYVDHDGVEAILAILKTAAPGDNAAVVGKILHMIKEVKTMRESLEDPAKIENKLSNCYNKLKDACGKEAKQSIQQCLVEVGVLQNKLLKIEENKLLIKKINVEISSLLMSLFAAPTDTEKA